MVTHSPEFRLVCAACQWPPGEARDNAVRAEASEPSLDWDRVMAVAGRQRVWGLAANALRAAGVAMPEPIAARFKARAEMIARNNLAAAAETARLGERLDAARIAWICFKGLPLASEAYGTLAVKMANDIDLLVPVDAAERACSVLRAAGYVRFSPGTEVRDDQLTVWMHVSKEVGWRHPEKGLVVELHTRTLENRALLPDTYLSREPRRVTIAPGITMPTMREAQIFPYLVAHGANHGWFRLKWLADVAALLSDRDAAAVERCYAEAEAMGVERCAAQALLLAHDLLALPLPPAFERKLRGKRINRLLVRIALRSMAGGHEARDHSSPAARTMLPVRLANLLLRPGLRYKWSELATLATNPVDRAKERLPRQLSFLYPLLGGARWSARMLGIIGRT